MIRTMFALLLATAVPALAGPIDERLSETQPCRDLPGISETETVALDRAQITVLPETATMTLTGRLACGSGEGAMFSGDASVSIRAEVEVALEGCTATASEVRLSDFGGSLGGVVEALAPSLESELAGDVAEAAEDLCRDAFD